MLSLPEPVKIFLYTQPTDMRKGFDSLAALVQAELGQNPLSGHLFVFKSRRGNRVKLLLWEPDGFVLYYKRLERGSFRFPAAADKTRSLTVTHQELSLLLWGIDPTSVQRQKRYVRPAG